MSFVGDEASVEGACHRGAEQRPLGASADMLEVAVGKRRGVAGLPLAVELQQRDAIACHDGAYQRLRLTVRRCSACVGRTGSQRRHLLSLRVFGPLDGEHPIASPAGAASRSRRRCRRCGPCRIRWVACSNSSLWGGTAYGTTIAATTRYKQPHPRRLSARCAAVAVLRGSSANQQRPARRATAGTVRLPAIGERCVSSRVAVRVAAMASGGVQHMATGLIAAVKDMLKPRAAPTGPTQLRLYLHDTDLQQQIIEANVALGLALIRLTHHRSCRASEPETSADAWDAEHARLVTATTDARRRLDAAWESCAARYGDDTARESKDTSLLMFVPIVRGLDTSPGPALDMPWTQPVRDAAEQHSGRQRHIQRHPADRV